MPSTDFIVRRQNLPEAKFVPGVVSEHVELASGQVLLKVGTFAFTANNITYAVFGEMMGYWNFFPTDDPSWGRIPVWGFGDVERSNHPDIAEGERIFGYFPMSTYVLVHPDGVTPSTFSDTSSHRAGLHRWYNRYFRCAGDPLYDPANEDIQPVFWPLFMTGWMISDLFTSNDCFGAQTVVVSSASSKTSFCFAHALSQDSAADVRIVGLTSTGNKAFVQGLGCYDSVVTYDALDTLPKDTKAAYVDMSGNADIRSAVHHAYADDLTYSCMVGATHYDKGGMSDALPGPDPAFFFVPDYADMRANEWGEDVFLRRFADAWGAFVPVARNWVSLKVNTGSEGLEAAYRNVLAGNVAPDEGQLVTP